MTQRKSDAVTFRQLVGTCHPSMSSVLTSSTTLQSTPAGLSTLRTLPALTRQRGDSCTAHISDGLPPAGVLLRAGRAVQGGGRSTHRLFCFGNLTSTFPDVLQNSAAQSECVRAKTTEPQKQNRSKCLIVICRIFFILCGKSRAPVNSPGDKIPYI